MPPAELPAAAIADAGPLIHLDELGVLDLLSGFSEVMVPSVVAAEASRHRLGWQQRAPAVTRIVEPDPERVERVRSRSDEERLDPGEVAALALWQEHQEAVLLCDDLAARRRAAAMGCEVAGTLGILLWAARTSTLDEERTRALLASIPTRSTLHLTPALLDAALRSLEADG